MIVELLGPDLPLIYGPAASLSLHTVLSRKVFGKHVKSYLSQLAMKTIRGRRVSPKHVKYVRDRLDRVTKECRFQTLRDLAAGAVGALPAM